MRDEYQTPFNTRYASTEMKRVFSPNMKFTTWRSLWIALAEAQKELGLDITSEQIEEMRKSCNNINYEEAEVIEKETRHDVMAHIRAYGMQCPKAKGIIHLGATSCYVGDNTDLILMRNALNIIKRKIAAVIDRLSGFAMEFRALPALGYTHFQPAQPVTVGKRACMWIQDLLMDLDDVEYITEKVGFLGSKGTTGTQASFLKLFNGNHEKVKKLDKIIADKMDFHFVYPITGQTYPRKLDSRILCVLSSVAQSAYKFSNDIRILQSLKEIEEPFEKEQVGSSAMAYKRNPMRCERISALSRYVIVNSLNPAITASTQWFERTLDDSANRRISIPEAFLATDAVLNIYMNVSEGLVVYPMVIEKHLRSEIPFMATENILMEAVKRGGDRQEIHEKIRGHSMAAAKNVKAKGGENDLLKRIASDEAFGLTQDELDLLLDPSKYIGRAPEQVEEFISTLVRPRIKKIDFSHIHSELNV